jgi:hypothetical protein
MLCLNVTEGLRNEFWQNVSLVCQIRSIGEDKKVPKVWILTSRFLRSSFEHPDKRIMDTRQPAGALNNYVLGTRIELHSMAPVNSPEESPVVSLSIVRHLAVGPERRSQVVVASLESGTVLCTARPTFPPLLPGTRIVAKVFDPELGWFEDGEWEGSRIGYSAHLSANETTAYTKLASMNGFEVPIFYGKFKFGDAFVILLELVEQPSLLQYSIRSPEEDVATQARWAVSH